MSGNSFSNKKKDKKSNFFLLFSFGPAHLPVCLIWTNTVGWRITLCAFLGHAAYFCLFFVGEIIFTHLSKEVFLETIHAPNWINTVGWRVLFRVNSHRQCILLKQTQWGEIIFPAFFTSNAELTGLDYCEWCLYFLDSSYSH